jgi:hypothetical protein
MQIAVRSSGNAGPVTVADVNLKFMWDVISRIKIGEKGKAYVVDSEGYLIADPDIGLVLRKTDLSGFAHVRAALDGTGAEERVVVTRDAGGTEVLSARIDRWAGRCSSCSIGGPGAPQRVGRAGIRRAASCSRHSLLFWRAA